VNIAELFVAVGARWTAAGLDTTVTGGLHVFDAPEGTDMPYAIMAETGSNVPWRASSGDTTSREDSTDFQISLIAAAPTLNAAAKTAAKAIHDAFENASLSISGAKLVRCRWLGESLLHDPLNPNALEWVQRFTAVAVVETATTAA